MTITGIEKTKRGRYSLFADGAFLFSVHPDIYSASQLRPGLEMAVEEPEALRLEDEFYSAKDKALTLLSYAPHSAGMLAEKLRRHWDEEIVLRVVERMEELDLLDDGDYAARLARDLVNLKGWSLNRVRLELKKRKLPPDAVEEALEQFDEDSDLTAALRVIRKKYRSRLGDEDGIRRTIAALQRQGFSLGIIRQALERLEEEGWEEP